MSFVVYIIRNAQSELYTGMTANLLERLNSHNSNQVVTTRGRGPWEVVITEKCDSRMLARNREKYWKSAAGRRRRRAILDNQELPFEYRG